MVPHRLSQVSSPRCWLCKPRHGEPGGAFSLKFGDQAATATGGADLICMPSNARLYPQTPVFNRRLLSASSSAAHSRQSRAAGLATSLSASIAIWHARQTPFDGTESIFARAERKASSRVCSARSFAKSISSMANLPLAVDLVLQALASHKLRLIGGRNGNSLTSTGVATFAGSTG